MSDLSDQLIDYHFDLPEELIAQTPASTREEARLLLVRRDPEQGLPRFEDLLVSDIPHLIQEEKALKNGLWVRNRSRVIPARFYAKRSSGGGHEIVLLEEETPGRWTAMIRNQAAFRYPQKLLLENDPTQEIVSPSPGIIDLSSWGNSTLDILERIGEMPLPPYIRQRESTRDRDRYQPVWARPDKAASVAAPTASLHFSPQLVSEMEKQGARFADIVLHVGLGTFEPVRVAQISQHELHSERVEVSHATLESIRTQSQQKTPVIALGTTALRTLESLSLNNEAFRPSTEWRKTLQGLEGRTAHFIRPGVEIRYATALFTNFHLPQSTLFVLVATFANSRALAQEAYRHAITKRYRFFSFGDASIWI